jgi:arylsulfatase A-like enzyme
MLNRDALDWIARQRTGRPFFIFLNYYDAHGPWIPPVGPDPRFGLGALPADRKIEILKRYQASIEGKLSPADGEAWAIERDAMSVYRDSYESCIAYLDRQIGLLHQGLRRLGVLEDTLVIVTSDHGEHFNERGFRGHGLSLYRREVHVPLLIIPPSGSTAGTSIEEPVSTREIPATIAEWVGLGGRSPFPGRSLTRFLNPGEGSRREVSPVLCELQHQASLRPMVEVPASRGPVASLASREWVYIHDGDGREELYRPRTDPLELHDLAGDMESRPVLEHFRSELGRLSRGEASSNRR